MTHEEFKSMRVDKGYSRTDIAKAIGRHRNTVRYWETDRTPVPKFAADWISKADAKKVSA